MGYSSTSKAYRIWVPDWQKIVTTRDVRFTNKLNPVSKYEDIICSQTNNGRFGILDKSSTEASHNETEIGPSVNLDLEHPNNVKNDNLIDEPLENVNRDDNVDLKRGPGRPRKVYTGKAGRPAKQYNFIRIDQSINSQDEAAPSDEENESWHEAEFAMNSMEIPFKEAIVGPDQDEWKNAI